MCGARHEAAVPEAEDGTLPAGVMDGAGRVVLGPDSRELRRVLRPIEWVVLEDVALDARRDGAGDLVAPTSARRVAEHLGLTPGAVARALARLRAAGLLTHARQAGPAGRFGLSAYALGPVPGLEVLEPADTPERSRPQPPSPGLAPPQIDGPHAANAHMVGAKAAADPHVVGVARHSLHDDGVGALAAGVEGVASEERARSAVARSSARRRRRTASKSAVAQLSILDATDDAGLDTDHDRQS